MDPLTLFIAGVFLMGSTVLRIMGADQAQEDAEEIAGLQQQLITEQEEQTAALWELAVQDYNALFGDDEGADDTNGLIGKQRVAALARITQQESDLKFGYDQAMDAYTEATERLASQRDRAFVEVAVEEQRGVASAAAYGIRSGSTYSRVEQVASDAVNTIEEEHGYQQSRFDAGRDEAQQRFTSGTELISIARQDVERQYDTAEHNAGIQLDRAEIGKEFDLSRLGIESTIITTELEHYSDSLKWSVLTGFFQDVQFAFNLAGGLEGLDLGGGQQAAASGSGLPDWYSTNFNSNTVGAFGQ